MTKQVYVPQYMITVHVEIYSLRSYTYLVISFAVALCVGPVCVWLNILDIPQ